MRCGLGCGEKKGADKEVVHGTIEMKNADEDKAIADVKFPVYDFDGLEPLLYKEDDKTYIVNFWATWCKPCIEEMPHFERVYAEQKNNNVEVILVSLDMPNMWKTQLEPFVEKCRGNMKNDPHFREGTLMRYPTQKVSFISLIVRSVGGLLLAHSNAWLKL